MQQAERQIDAKTLRLLCTRAAEKLTHRSEDPHQHWATMLMCAGAAKALATLSEEIVIYLGEQAIKGENDA